MRLREAVRFSVVVFKLAIVDSKRFWEAPSVPRVVLMVLMAASSVANAFWAPEAVVKSSDETPAPAVAVAAV